MQIPLNQFEEYIDETILERGLSYYLCRYIQEIEEIRPGEYEAIVEGTENYNVHISISNGDITKYNCDCPYDIGPICKHIVAVLYQLKQEKLELSNNSKKKHTVKRKTVVEQVEEMLEQVTHEELKVFIREKAVANQQFRNLFLSSFAHHNSNESKELYIKQLNSILKSATRGYDFIDWSAISQVLDVVESLLESAQEQIDKGNYKSAFFMCTAIMEQMTKELDYIDDSDGDIYRCIEDALELLKSIAEKELSDEIRKLMIEYCFTTFDNQIYSDWDWHIDVLRLASVLLKTEEEIEQIFKLIDKTQRSNYDKEEAQKIKYEILLKTKGESAAETYVEQNITNSELRRIAIQKALNKKEYEKAISIAKDGINYNLKDKPGLAKEWYDWLLKIAQAQNDSEKIIEYARLLFVDNYRHEQDYYQILKNYVDSEIWNTFVEDLIKDITTRKPWYYTSLIANIFIKEELWDRLLELVKKSPSLDNIERYEEFLSKDYSNELVELYKKGILDYLKSNMGRSHYQNACKYIRRIIKLGARQKANEVISYLKVEYRKRKALIEELGKI